MITKINGKSGRKGVRGILSPLTSYLLHFSYLAHQHQRACSRAANNLLFIQTIAM